MKQLVTRAIVLSRVNYGEADRILTAMTLDYGKLSLMAKGVRRAKSKLAGGIELFSTSQITFIKGRGEVSTLVSSRLEKHYSNVVKDLNRVNLGYNCLKLVNKNTEPAAEPSYYRLLESSLAALGDTRLPLQLVRLYFEANLLALAGHSPNLASDSNNYPLESAKCYNFSPSEGFMESNGGAYSSSNIKFLRLVFAGNSAAALARVNEYEKLVAASQPLVTTMTQHYLRI